MLITRTSQMTGETRTINLPVTQEQMDEFISPNSRYIQDIFPNLQPHEREFILTGITQDEWELLTHDYDD